jgi:hypothetical protein
MARSGGSTPAWAEAKASRFAGFIGLADNGAYVGNPHSARGDAAATMQRSNRNDRDAVPTCACDVSKRRRISRLLQPLSRRIAMHLHLHPLLSMHPALVLTEVRARHARSRASAHGPILPLRQDGGITWHRLSPRHAAMHSFTASTRHCKRNQSLDGCCTATFMTL